MAALDFPNNPTVGQIWVGTNGAIYAWDGTVWTISAITPGGSAGGDLTGNYPNPQIAANAVTDPKVHDVSWAKITGAPPMVGPVAYGDLGGNYPNPVVLQSSHSGGFTILNAQPLQFMQPSTTPVSGTALGIVSFMAGNIITGANIVAITDENWTASAHGSRVSVGVTRAGTGSPTEILRLPSDGFAYFGPSTRLRIGTFTQPPRESIECRGILLGAHDQQNPIAGTIEWNGTNFRAFNGTTWTNFG